MVNLVQNGAGDTVRSWEECVDDISSRFSLNVEQDAAFRIVCQHTASKTKNIPLRLYLGGPGGTGKSRVMQAISSYFEVRGESRRLRLAAYTGIAASNIGGVTLHSSLMLLNAEKKCSARVRNELATMWQGVDHLIIDEVSMIGCEMLFQIHEALCVAKSTSAPFGGINIIFAGDFAQLPPIGQAKLFTSISYMTNKQTKLEKRQRTLLGKLLWLGVDNVVMLKQPMRQATEGSKRFVELLSRLREGICTQSDYDLLNGRLLDKIAKPGTRLPDVWAGAAVLVTDNASKDAINDAACRRFAEARGISLDEFSALDFQNGNEIRNATVKQELAFYHTGRTEYRANVLYLLPRTGYASHAMPELFGRARGREWNVRKSENGQIQKWE